MQVSDVLAILAEHVFHGNKNQSISAPTVFDVHNLSAENIMWVNDKNMALIENLAVGTVICSHNFDVKNRPADVNLIQVSNPRATFALVLNKFFTEKSETGISANASIHESVVLGKDVFIGHNVVIEKGCTIGNNARILHNTVIFKGTVICNDVTIGANCTIGGVGFGYEKDIDGEYTLIPHIGNVVIEDKVEIGNNTTIDRAVMGSTILKKNSKIDNLVHIAHGVEVGENSLVIANAMVAGSVVIGKNVWVAPSSSVLNKVIIADNALVGMGAVVLRNVNEGAVMVGNPAKALEPKKP